MALGKNFIAVALFACLAITSGNQIESLTLPSLFPDGKTFVYDYFGEIKSGLIEPAEFNSKYGIKGTFYISRYNPDTILVTLQNASIGVNNGRAEDFENTTSYAPIPEVAKALEKPTLLIYNLSGSLLAVEFSEDEPAWSKNIKFAWASLLQLTLHNVSLEPEQNRGYISSEKTIHGNCQTSFDINTKYPGFNESQTLVVTKFASPSACSHFSTQVFDYANPDSQKNGNSDESVFNTASYKSYEVKKENNVFLLQKINSFGEFNYFPFGNTKQDAYYIRNTVTLNLKQVVPSDDIKLPAFNTTKASTYFHWRYQSSKTNYGEGAALDITNGRHLVNQEDLINEAQQLLINAGSYIEENQIEAKELNWQRSKSINKILEILSRADISSLEKIFSRFQNETLQAKGAARGLFIGIVPQVGTTAASLFVWNLVKNQLVSDFEAMELLTKLPTNIREPSEEILAKLDPMINDNKSLAPKVRKSAILAFSTLISRTFSNVSASDNNETLEKYLKFFCDRLFNEPEYGFQLAYISAINNIQVGNIYNYLESVVRGVVKISDRPNNIRLLAIWATQKPLASNYTLGYQLYWPIMSDYSLPLSLRVAAYEYLIHNAKSMTDVLRIHWFMAYEKSEHFYNYHFSIIKILASSSDPSNQKLKEYAIKILRFTRVPHLTSENISTSQSFETVDKEGNGLKFRFSIIFNENTNLVEQIYAGQTFFEGHKIVSNWGLYLNIGCLDNIMRFLNVEILKLKEIINEAFILEFIKKFPAAIAAIPDSHIEMILLYRGRSVMSNYYNNQSWVNLNNDIDNIIKTYITPSSAAALNNSDQVVPSYHVFYHNLFEQYFINDMGIPIIFYGRSPAVYALTVSRNQSAEGTSVETDIDAKLWLIHEYAASIYNPLNDSWHSVGQTSMIVAHVSFQNDVNLNPAFELLKMVYPKNWDVKFTGADVLMINKNTVSINNYNSNNRLSPYSTYEREVIVTKDVNNSKNSTAATIINHEFEWEIISFDCENETDITSSKKLIESWKDIKNYEFDLFPISIKLKNCGNFIKIKPINKLTPVEYCANCMK